jgi:hypothetical protein
VENFTVNKVEFIAALEQELWLRGRAYSRADVQEFVAAAWRLIEDDPDVHRWVLEFVNATVNGGGAKSGQ